ncbi:hypothetical protein LJC55_02320 [Eubacteriales bacterium OttesenSCG-928-N14]|nr:hypothetical protein [Eubacteriales bacterium OttesenSCG-928-N14]
MKRACVVLFALMMFFTLVACGSGSILPTLGPTPTPEPVGYTLSNPAPLGTTITVTSSLPEDEQILSLTTGALLTGDEAIAKYNEIAYYALWVPVDGKDLILIEFTIKLDESANNEDFEANLYAFEVYSGEERLYDDANVSTHIIDRPELTEGEQGTTWLAFMVDKDDEKPVLRYNYFSDDAWFALY